MRSKKVKVVCAMLTAAMILGSYPDYAYATETGGDSSSNTEEDATEFENEDTSYIDVDLQDIDLETAPEGYIPGGEEITDNKEEEAGAIDEKELAALDDEKTLNDYEAMPNTADVEQTERTPNNSPALLAATISGTWIEDNGRLWYRHDDGSYSRSKWEMIDYYWYYFDTSGWMKTGWLKWDNKTYYLNTDEDEDDWPYGATLIGLWYIGSLNADRSTWPAYRFLDDGSMFHNGWNLYYGDWSYYYSDGHARRTGWFKDDGKWYYIKEDGDSWPVAVENDWRKVDGNWYYFESGCAMVTGWKMIGKTWYYFNSSGIMLTDWHKYGDSWYYLGPANDGAMRIGWFKVGDTWYYSNDIGEMKTGWVKDGKYWYYMNESGAMKTGWLKLGNTWYFLKSNGMMATGWLKDGSHWYYMGGENDGAMKKGWFNVGSQRFYTDSNGFMQTGWQTIDNKRYYFGGADDGAMTKDTWRWVGSDCYSFDASGVMETGWLRDTYKDSQGNSYYEWSYCDASGRWQVTSDVKGCEHGRATFLDKRMTTDLNDLTFHDYTTEYGEYITGSINWWETAMPEITITSTNSNDANFNFHDTQLDQGVIALTQVYEINKYTSTTGRYDWPSAEIFFNKYSQSSRDVSNTAHEIGHALGLSHIKSRHSGGFTLMHPTQPQVTITDLDIDNVRHIY